MLKFVLGPSGAGKTKWLIDQANADKNSGNGNIVFIDTDDSHIFSLDHSVRLINAKEFGVNSLQKLFGFLFGIVSRDFDIEKIYVDGIYSIIDIDPEKIACFKKTVDEFSTKHKVEIFMGLNIPKEDLSEELLENHVEVKLQ